MKLNNMRIDLQKELDGVWIPYIGDVQLLVARMTNDRFQASQRRVLREKGVNSMQDLPEEDVAEMSKPGVAEFVLLGWKNIEDEDGNEVVYSKEKALEIFNDPELSDMYTFVVTRAQKASLFRQKDEEEMAGN